MIEAWSTDDVYAAEEALMATLADGELMARAVSGLAAVAAARLRGAQGHPGRGPRGARQQRR